MQSTKYYINLHTLQDIQNIEEILGIILGATEVQKIPDHELSSTSMLFSFTRENNFKSNIAQIVISGDNIPCSITRSVIEQQPQASSHQPNTSMSTDDASYAGLSTCGEIFSLCC